MSPMGENAGPVRVTEVNPMEGYRIWLLYDDGVERVKDLSDIVEHEPFAPVPDGRRLIHSHIQRPHTGPHTHTAQAYGEHIHIHIRLRHTARSYAGTDGERAQEQS